MSSGHLLDLLDLAEARAKKAESDVLKNKLLISRLSVNLDDYLCEELDGWCEWSGRNDKRFPELIFRGFFLDPRPGE